MVKKVIMLSSLIFASAVTNASYLLWQVSAGEVAQSYSAGSWDTARIYAFNDSTLNDYPSLSGEAALKNVAYVSGSTYTELSPSTDLVYGDSTLAYVADISSFDNVGYSFFVELWNSETSQRVGFSQIQNVASSSNLKGYYASTEAITAALSATTLASMSIWHGAGYNAVPEPTSAMLMLFGAAFLGLKRKNRRIA